MFRYVMPRGPRLDAPGTLHHVTVRGIEGRRLFRDDRDRDDFLRRLKDLAQAEILTVYAWALLSNHVHLLVRTGARPLSRAMRSLLTGYAGAFNRRHHRRGHLFQNRYKSIIVEEEPYFLELVRYLHLNPLRAGVVKNLRELDGYPYTGHAVMMGRRTASWQHTNAVLGRFGRNPGRARSRYRAFVAAGVPQGRREELQGGGLRRSAGGWIAVHVLRRGREVYAYDERILGNSDFVTRLLEEMEKGHPQTRGSAASRVNKDTLIRKVCSAVGIHPDALTGEGRRPAVAEARAGIAFLWIECLGRSGPQLAPALGLQPAAVYKAARRGQDQQARWRRVLEDL